MSDNNRRTVKLPKITVYKMPDGEKRIYLGNVFVGDLEDYDSLGNAVLTHIKDHIPRPWE
jgi:hypothetical protein